MYLKLGNGLRILRKLSLAFGLLTPALLSAATPCNFHASKDETTPRDLTEPGPLKFGVDGVNGCHEPPRVSKAEEKALGPL